MNMTQPSTHTHTNTHARTRAHESFKGPHAGDEQPKIDTLVVSIIQARDLGK